MTPPHSKSKTKRNGLPSYDSFISSHELKLHRAGCFWACDVSGCEIKGATRKKDIDRHARKHAAEKEKHNGFSQLCDREATRGGKSDF